MTSRPAIPARTVYRLDDESGYVAADAGGWLPGVFASEAEARAAIATTDLAWDVAQLWTDTEFANLRMPLSLAEALDRLAIAYGFEGRGILGWDDE